MDYRSSPDPLAAFLFERRGFCQQYATAYAAMARAVGLPARVAVGFSYGEPDNPDHPTKWTVRGRNAHAWPEVYIAGTGWVAFEPTPGHGNPDATGYSGLTVAQDTGGAAPANATGSTTSTTQAPSASTSVPPTTVAATPPTTVRPAVSPASTGGGGAWPVVELVLGIVGLLGGAMALRAWWTTRRRALRRASTQPVDRRALDAWTDSCRDLRRVGIRPSAAETPVEFSRRAAAELALGSLVELGTIESERRYGADDLDEDTAGRASAITDEVRERVWSRLPARSRIRGRFDL